MYKINQLPPNLNIAIKVANKLDEMGIHKDANLIDEFINKSKNLEMTKQAGLWSAIWNRLGGLTKRLFFKEYRELYNSAKDANQKIKERMDKAKELLKESEDLFNNYELLQWREKVRILPIYTKDLMFDFESKFGKLVAFTYKLQQIGEVPSGGEFSLKDVSAPEGTEDEEKKQEKIPGASQFKEMVQKSRESKDEEPPWPRHGLLQLFAIPPEKDAVAIWSDYFNKDIFNVHLAKNKDGNFVLTTEGRSKRPGARIAPGWFENFFKGEWKFEKEEGGWTYLRRVKAEAEKVTPETKIEKEILMPKSPASLLPGGVPGSRTALETEPVTKKEPTAAELTPKELDESLGEIKKVEEKKEEDLYNKMLQDIQNHEWVVFTSGPNKGQYGLLKKTLISGGKSKYGEFSQVLGQEEVNKLNNAYFEKFYKDKEKKVKGVGKKFKLEEGKLTKASLVNNLLFRGK